MATDMKEQQCTDGKLHSGITESLQSHLYNVKSPNLIIHCTPAFMKDQKCLITGQKKKKKANK